MAFAQEIARRLSSERCISAKVLAELFRHADGSDQHSLALRHTLQKFLLGRTLAHAVAHVPYYAGEPAYAAWRPSEDDSPPNLDGLPVLERARVVERFDEFHADDVTPRSVCHTSGSTGLPLDVYKSFEEVSFIGDYFNAMFRPLRQRMSSIPLSLSFPNVYHGVPVPIPGIGMGFISGVTDDTLIEDARRALERTYNIRGHDRRISFLSGLIHHVLFFTSYLREQGVDPRACKLSGVTVTGGFLSSHWMKFLQDSWGCMVSDRFTLTEAIGGASRLPGGDVFQLDSHLFGEVIDPDSHRALDVGVGVLALTSLHPFVQMQPMLRYTTGDLVRRVPGSNGATAFQFLGKLKNCVATTRDGRREWLLFSTRLHELLAGIPDVSVNDWFSNVRVAADRSVGSLPLASVHGREEDGRTTVGITLELRYAPHTHSDRTEALRRLLTEGLRDTPDTTLARRLDDGSVRLDIRMVGPGQFRETPIIKI